MNPIHKIAIANRGEVACRIHRTCEKLGIKTVLLHSEPDIKTKAFRMCNETFNIGPGPTSESYLNIDAQIKGALAMGADAIHPGFGFLSENADFAKKVIEAGLIFIGPNPETIESFGDKIKAKSLCKLADVPMVPGYQNQNANLETLIQECDKIGYPVLVKAAAGGGGRGMRLIQNKAMAESEIQSAMNEALKAFGNSTVFLEKYLDHAKHIEVQIFGDAQGHIHVLGERECSVQRKHQKIIEETPSPSLNAKQREELFSYAKKIGETGHYLNAGTVEFMFQDQQFYFLEVNTRLQVEHTVTEEVLGIDLVEAQILTAQGKPVQLPKVFNPTTHSIELRLYAEDPYQNGIPSTGRLGTLDLPLKPGRRLEIGIEPNDEISPYYDSMIAKLISTQKTRIEAITDLISWINESTIFGVQTNRPLLKKILSHSDFIIGTMNTKFFENNFSKSLNHNLSPEDQQKIESKLIKFIQTEPSSQNVNTNPWTQGWRESELFSKSSFDLSKIKYEQVGLNLWFQIGEDTFKIDLRKKNKNTNEDSSGLIKAPMPGSVFKVLCSVGQTVELGQTLVVIEAMKMEHSMKTDQRGKVSKINFKPGESVQDDDILIEIEVSK
jgi:acetyl/propionyl-CoA carboxylase alpha subunit